jgi:hypothetical protein
MSMKIIEQIKEKVAQLEIDGKAFFEKGTKIAGPRTRKTAQELKLLMQELRESVSSAKK